MSETTHDYWYASNTGSSQGLIISELDGRTVAVAYDEKDTNLLAAAPELRDFVTSCTECISETELLDFIQNNAEQLLDRIES
jgi:hypothetical protein